MVACVHVHADHRTDLHVTKYLSQLLMPCSRPCFADTWHCLLWLLFLLNPGR